MLKGTGYYKTSWKTSEIKPEMAEVTLTKKGEGIAWGGLYWQYFEDLDKITNTKTPLQLTKKLFLKSNTDTGKVLTEINKSSPLKLGDLITVRIELRARSNSFSLLKVGMIIDTNGEVTSYPLKNVYYNNGLNYLIQYFGYELF